MVHTGVVAAVVVALMVVGANGLPDRTYTSCKVISLGSFDYRVYWNTTTGASTEIAMAFEADASSWVGFGVGGVPDMNGIDTQVAMMTSGGIIVDGKSSTTDQPTADGSDDNTEVSVKSVGGVLTAEFKRALNTGDGSDEVWLATGDNSVVYAAANGGVPASPTSYTEHDSKMRTTLDFSVASSCPPPPVSFFQGLNCQDTNSGGMRVYYETLSGSPATLTMGLSFPSTTGWAAFGLLTGSSMSGGDYAMAYLDGTTPHVRDGFRTAAFSGPISYDATNDFTNVVVERTGGVLRAKWERPVAGGAQDVALVTGANSAAWAYNGDAIPSDPPVSGDIHSQRGKFTVDLTAASTCTPAPPPPPAGGSGTINLDNAFSFSDGAFSMRFKVDAAAGTASFAINVAAGGYAALGLAGSAGAMSPADVYAVYASTSAPGGFVVSDRLNSGRSSNADPIQNVLAVSGETVNGVTTVSFVRNLNTGDPADTIITNSDMSFVWAVGSAPAAGAGSATSGMSKHSVRSTDEIKINFFTGKISKDDLRERVIKAHAWLMILAWTVLVPAAILIARFAKDALGVWWYRIHLGTQMLAVLMTFAAFGMAIWFTVDDFKGENKGHKGLGLFIVIMAFIQPILGELANLMWSPDRAGTPIFPDKLHWVIGYGLFLLGIVNCFLGMKAKEWGLGGNIVVGIFVAAAVIGFAVLQFVMGAVHHNGGDEPDKSGLQDASIDDKNL